MKIPEEAICSVCKQIFCCGKCREKHEIKHHAIRIRKSQPDVSTGKEQLDDFNYVICPICINRPFPLHEVIHAEMLDHIKRNHLPLHCQKCAKVYERINDLREFSKCVQRSLACEKELITQAFQESSCVLEMVMESVTTQQNTISTQTSSYLESQFNGISSITPISMLNLQWKTKSKTTHHQDITDSVSSIKNLSSITNSTSLRRSIGSAAQVMTQGKLVRTTSTPVHAETEKEKPKEHTFDASGSQVSSIYNSRCDTENQNSPLVANVGGGSTFIRHQPEAVNLYRKFNGRTKIAAVTPLRHVMSKSIQKAFAEHGLPLYSDKKATEPNEGGSRAIFDAFSSSPLDLRLSPALRRSQSDSFFGTRFKSFEKAQRDEKFKKITATPKDKQTVHNCIIAGKLKTESIMITRTQQVSCYQTSDDKFNTEPTNSAILSVSSTSSNSIYKTCQSFEILTSTDLDEIGTTENGVSSNERNYKSRSLKFKYPNGNHSSTGHNIVSITPITRLTGSSINKKAIKFDTPKIENKSESQTPTFEKFYTPVSSPRSNAESVGDDPLSKLAVVRNLSARFSPSRRPSIRECAQSTTYSHYEDEIYDASSNDEVFLEKTEVNLRSDETEQAGSGGFLKSLVNSVMRLPSLKGKSNLITHRPGIHAKNTSKTSIIKRCASIAGSLVRSTSLVDEKQLQTLKRKRTHTIDSQINLYRPVCHLESTTCLDFANQNDLSSTKRFRIQGRKPIERMRTTNS